MSVVLLFLEVRALIFLLGLCSNRVVEDRGLVDNSVTWFTSGDKLHEIDLGLEMLEYSLDIDQKIENEPKVPLNAYYTPPVSFIQGPTGMTNKSVDYPLIQNIADIHIAYKEFTAEQILSQRYKLQKIQDGVYLESLMYVVDFQDKSTWKIDYKLFRFKYRIAGPVYIENPAEYKQDLRFGDFLIMEEVEGKPPSAGYSAPFSCLKYMEVNSGEGLEIAAYFQHALYNSKYSFFQICFAVQNYKERQILPVGSKLVTIKLIPFETENVFGENIVSIDEQSISFIFADPTNLLIIEMLEVYILESLDFKIAKEPIDNLAFYFKGQNMIFFPKYINSPLNIKEGDYLALYDIKLKNLRFIFKELLIIEYCVRPLSSNECVPEIGIINIYEKYGQYFLTASMDVNNAESTKSTDEIHPLAVLKKCLAADKARSLVDDGGTQEMRDQLFLHTKNCFLFRREGQLLNTWVTGEMEEILVLEFGYNEKVIRYSWIRGQHTVFDSDPLEILDYVSDRKDFLSTNKLVLRSIWKNMFVNFYSNRDGKSPDCLEIAITQIQIGSREFRKNITFPEVKNLSDDMLAIEFEEKNGILIYRGLTSFFLIQLHIPKLVVKRKEDESDLEIASNEEIKGNESHCFRKRSIVLSYSPSSIIGTMGVKMTKTLHYCYSPAMSFGSSFITPSLSKKDSDLDDKRYIIGSTISIGVTERRQGSFLEIVYDSDTKNNSTNNKNMMLELRSLEEQKYSYTYPSRDGKLQGVFGIVTKHETMNLQFTIFTSHEFNNMFRQGKLFQSTNPGKLIDTNKQDELQEYRDFTNIELIAHNIMLMQVEDTSYRVDILNNKVKFSYWSGINGVCKISTLVKIEEVGNAIICFGENNFYLKYLDSQLIDQTVKIGGESLLIEGYDGLPGTISIEVIKLTKYGQSKNQFLVFYSLQKELGKTDDPRPIKVQSVVMNILNEPFYHLQRSIEIENLIPNSVRAKDILDIVATKKHIITIALESEYGQLVYAIYVVSITTRINNKLSLPSEIGINTKNFKFEVAKIYNTELKAKAVLADKLEEFEESVTFLVHLPLDSNNEKNSFENYIAVIDPDKTTINMINLVSLPNEYEIVNCGPAFYNSSNGVVDRKLVIAGKPKNTEDPKDDEKDREMRIFLIKSLSSNIYATFNKLGTIPANLKEVDYSEKTLKFRIITKFPYNTYKMRETTQFKGYYVKEESKEIVVTCSYKEWFPYFWNVNISTRIDVSKMESDNYELLSNIIVEVDLDFSKYPQGPDNARFIRFPITKFATGNVYNISSLVFSDLEARSGLVEVAKFMSGEESIPCLNYSVGEFLTQIIIQYRCAEGFEFNMTERRKYGCSMKEYDANDQDDQHLELTVDDAKSSFLIQYSPALNVGVERKWNANKVKNQYTADIRSNVVVTGGHSFYLKKLVGSSHVEETIYYCIKGPIVERFSRNRSSNDGNDYICTPDHRNLDVAASKFKVFQINKTSFVLLYYNLNPSTKLYSQRIVITITSNSLATNESSLLTTKTHYTNIAVSSPTDNYKVISENEISIVSLSAKRNIGQSIKMLQYVMVSEIFCKIEKNLYPNKDSPRESNVTITEVETFVDFGETEADSNFKEFTLPVNLILPDRLDLPEFEVDGRSRLTFILCFIKANCYFIRIDEYILGDHESIIYAVPSRNEKILTTPKIYNLHEMSVAILSNPFIGFTPENENIEPGYLSSHLFSMIRNYRGESYLFNYDLTAYKLFKTNKRNVSHLFEFENEESLGLKQDEIYIPLSGMGKLKSRAFKYLIIPDCYGSDDKWEHKLIYISENGNVNFLNFTVSVKIVTKTKNIASQLIAIFLEGQGPFVVRSIVRLSNQDLFDSNSELVKGAITLLSSIATILAVSFFIRFGYFKKEIRKVKQASKAFNYIKSLTVNSRVRVTQKLMLDYVLFDREWLMAKQEDLGALANQEAKECEIKQKLVKNLAGKKKSVMVNHDYIHKLIEKYDFDKCKIMDNFVAQILQINKMMLADITPSGRKGSQENHNRDEIFEENYDLESSDEFLSD